MKRVLLISSLIIASSTFANGFNVKGGLNYNNQKLKEAKSSVVGVLLEGEYNHEVYKINDDLSFDIAGGLDVSVNYGSAKIADKEFATKDEGDEVKKVENKEKLIDFKNKLIKAKIKEDAKVKEEVEKQGNEKIKTILGAEENYTLKGIDTKINEEISFENVTKNKGLTKENTVVLSAEGYVLPKLSYKVQDDLKISGGIKLGLGYEGDFYLGKKNKDIKVDNQKNWKIELTKEEVKGLDDDQIAKKFNELNKGNLKKDQEIKKTEDIEAGTEEGSKKIKKASLTKLNDEVTLNIAKTIQHNVVVPVYAVFGVDYKNMKTAVELGGKVRPLATDKFVPGFRLSLGYSF